MSDIEAKIETAFPWMAELAAMPGKYASRCDPMATSREVQAARWFRSREHCEQWISRNTWATFRAVQHHGIFQSEHARKSKGGHPSTLLEIYEDEPPCKRCNGVGKIPYGNCNCGSGEGCSQHDVWMWGLECPECGMTPKEQGKAN